MNFLLFFVCMYCQKVFNGLNFELVQQDNKTHSKKDDSLYKILCKMLDGNLDSSFDISESRVWFALYHPKVLHTDFRIFGVCNLKVCILLFNGHQFSVIMQEIYSPYFYDVG